MKCYGHSNMDAVSQCSDCSRSLCLDCTDKYEFPICDGCNLIRAKADKNTFIKNMVIMVVLFFLGFNLNLANSEISTALLGGYFFASIPWGWSALNRITPNVFLFLPLAGWLIYFTVKLLLSMAIGVFVTPYKIYQSIMGIKRTVDMETNIKAA